MTTAVTLLVLVGILALGLFVGFRELFAPLPGEGDDSTTETAATCEPQDVQPGQRLRPPDVLVNVHNAGDRAGLASQTMATLDRRGFRTGEIANTSSGGRVKRVQVWIVEGEETAGRLVARNFGPKVKVRTRSAENDLGDGVDVVVSNRLRRVGPPVRAVRVRDDEAVCLPG
jgi:hypothetical protein